MIRYSAAPDRPDNFVEHVADAKKAIAEIIRARRVPDSRDFVERWKTFKNVLFAAQHNKCGYCESFLSNQPGDVEHFMPKAELQELPADETGWGKEGDGVFSVEGRRPEKISDIGYWWEAYSWENYLAACNRCNSGWKRNLFPVDETPRTVPKRRKRETTLLLNPFRGEDPADHLAYNKFGQVKALNGSKYGKATIATCGLDRPSLVQARNEKVTRAYALVEEYSKAQSADVRNRVIKDFLTMGSEQYIFAGMVRAIFKQKLKQSWEEWEKKLSKSEG